MGIKTTITPLGKTGTPGQHFAIWKSAFEMAFEMAFSARDASAASAAGQADDAVAAFRESLKGGGE